MTNVVTVPPASQLIADAERPTGTTRERALSALDNVLTAAGGQARANALVRALNDYGIDEADARAAVLDLVERGEARRAGGTVVRS